MGRRRSALRTRTAWLQPAWVLLSTTAVVEGISTLRHPELSFKGPVAADAIIPGWDQAGHATRIPSAEDFVRVVPAIPLAYGSMFTAKPLPFDQWTAEVAFRIHGATAAVASPAEGNQGAGKGGRGLAFWYTKESNPTPPVLPSTPPAKDKPHSSPPPLTPRNKDPTDPFVSFFGSRAPFEGLGVIFDTQPTTPVTPRSVREYWDVFENGGGAAPVGVVAGVMDDGRSSDWVVNKSKKSMKPEEEAGYLSHTIGDCEAAFRNAPGLVWAKISHHSGNISVDLDLSPHTSLSLTERHYSHRCFEAENIALPAGYHFGVTALASSNDEPDSIDIYAIEVREVVTVTEKVQEAERDRMAEQREELKRASEAPLQGTTASGEATLTYEMFSSQARMMEAITELSRRVEELSKRGSVAPGGQTAQSTAHLERKLDDILLRLGNGQPEVAELRTTVGKIFDHLATTDSKLANLQASLSNQHSASNQQSGDVLTILRQMQTEALAKAASASRLNLLSAFKFILGGIVAMGAVMLLINFVRGMRPRYGGDEGSFGNGAHARGQSFSLAMGQMGNSMGFRQRGGKKMI